MGKLHLRVWGLNLSIMNELSTLGQKQITGRKNVIAVSAGSEGETPGLIFKGTIYNAYSDFNAAPDVVFEVLATSFYFESTEPGEPISIRGSADVATMLSGVANQMGKPFENNGVNAKLSKSYYDGSLYNQAKSIVRDAGIDWNQGDGGTLAIWPKGGTRGGVIPLIGPQNGMIGYPVFIPTGSIIRAIFNPSVVFGGKVKIETDITPAAGIKQVNKLDHHLESLVPKGRWETVLQVGEPGSVVTAW